MANLVKIHVPVLIAKNKNLQLIGAADELPELSVMGTK